MSDSGQCRFCGKSARAKALAKHERQCPERRDTSLHLPDYDDESDDTFDVAGTIVDFSDDD